MEPYTMTAWEILKSRSSLPSGTAWQHLNAAPVTGGGTVTGNLVVSEGIRVSVETPIFAAVVLNEPLVVTLEPIETNIESSEIKVEIDG
jgi:hypothetical protein